MKRTRLKPKSDKMKIIDHAEKLLRKILVIERGQVCELCDKGKSGLGLFHILNKQKYPRLRLDPDNTLIAGWFCCHNRFHHDPFFARDKVFPRIEELRGKDYEDRLKLRHAMLPRMSATQASMYKAALEKELESL